MPEQNGSHFTENDRDVLHDVKDTVHGISPEIADYITDRLNSFTMQLSEHLSQTVSGTVRSTVNGKLDGFRKEFTDYVTGDLKWKERANPAIDFFINVTWSKKFILGVMGFLAAIFGLIIMIKSIFLK